MPRKGTTLSAEAAERQKKAIAKWKAEHMASVTVTVRKERAAAYRELAARRGTTLRAIITEHLDKLVEEEGLQ